MMQPAPRLAFAAAARLVESGGKDRSRTRSLAFSVAVAGDSRPAAAGRTSLPPLCSWRPAHEHTRHGGRQAPPSRDSLCARTKAAQPPRRTCAQRTRRTTKRGAKDMTYARRHRLGRCPTLRNERHRCCGALRSSGHSPIIRERRRPVRSAHRPQRSRRVALKAPCVSLRREQKQAAGARWTPTVARLVVGCALVARSEGLARHPSTAGANGGDRATRRRGYRAQAGSGA